MSNWRKPAYLAYASMRGYGFPSLLKRYWREYSSGIHPETTRQALSRLLCHCQENVPYYREFLAGTTRRQLEQDPLMALSRLPLLTKKIIRSHFDQLQSRDNHHRNCQVNTSGGSTGEPVQLIQDDDYRDASCAIRWLSQHQAGCDLGEPNVRLWGSECDLEQGTKSPKARFFNWLTNTTWLNAFNMSEPNMRRFIEVLNRLQPHLIVAYAQALYELARFAEREGLQVEPQPAVFTSAGTLYPFMRETISQIFQGEVYNLYGSREVSDIAWELPGANGLWVAPWANFLEIVDDDGQPVPAEVDGNIVVTCLTNLAMPLVRYWIGDRGALMPESQSSSPVQWLKQVLGRNVDMFRTRQQTLVDGEYFTHLLYFRPWVGRFQVVQKSYDHVVFKFVSSNGQPAKAELDEIAARSRTVMGQDCNIDFDFVSDLPSSPSGKFRYTISEVQA